MRQKNYWMLAALIVTVTLILPLVVYGQTQKGAVGLEFYGNISHSSDNDETTGQINVNPRYLLTDRVSFGFGASAAKDRCFDFETIYAFGGSVAYLFNLEPGKQRFIPVIGMGAGAGWGGGERVRVWGGTFGANYYINRSVGLSAGLFYQRNYPVSSRYDVSDSVSFSWGLFIQFNGGK